MSDQRTNSDINADHVSKLLKDRMADEMNFTAEQMDLVKSVISQCVSEERKFNDELSKEMLTSLQSLIDVQYTKSLDCHSMILELVSVEHVH